MSWQQRWLMWQLMTGGHFLIDNLLRNHFSDGFAQQKVHHWLQRELVSVSWIWSCDEEFSFDFRHFRFRAHMKLTIKGLSVGDFGNYRCISKNSLGETEGSIRVYGENHCLIHRRHRNNSLLNPQKFHFRQRRRNKWLLLSQKRVSRTKKTRETMKA